MKIPFYNFSSLHSENLIEKLQQKIGDLMGSSSFIEAPINLEFEENFARYMGYKHCQLVANGTDALEISLKILELPLGSKVALPAVSFFATAEAILNAGHVPVFVEVGEETGLMCPQHLGTVLEEEEVRVVMPVHLYGAQAPLRELQKVIKVVEEEKRKEKIFMIVDGAQAVGGERDCDGGEDLYTVSFYPTKNLGAMGDAGAILTNDDEFKEKINAHRNHGRGRDDWIGRNSRCDSFQALILNEKLSFFREEMALRRGVAKSYGEMLKFFEDKKQLTCPYKGSLFQQSSWHLFPILLRTKDEKESLHAYLEQHEVATRPFYDRPLVAHKALAPYHGDIVKSYLWCERVLCLPIHPSIGSEEVDYLKKTLQQFFS